MASRRDRSTEATQRALLRAGRRVFGRKGYASAGVGEVVARAQVTTGALYHHFGSKRRLFQAVAEQVEQELLAQAIALGNEYADPWQGLVAGVDEMLDARMAPEVRQIIMRDAPRVIGPTRWLEIEERYSLGLLRDVLSTMMDNGILRRADPGLLARALFVMANELASQVAESKEPAKTRAAAGEITTRFLEGFRR